MKHWILFATLLLFPSLAVAGHSLIFATEGAMPPYNWIDKNGVPQGFDPDLANALCAAMKSKCSIVTETWHFLPVGLLSDKFDVIISNLDMTVEREELMLFTDPYMSTTASFVAKKGRFSSYTPKRLSGTTIAALDDTVFEEYLDELYFQTSERLYTESTQEAFKLLVQGEADLVLTDTPVAKAFLASPEGAGFSLVSTPLTAKEVAGDAYIAVRREEHTLRDKLNAALKTVRESGEYQQIYDKYFKE